MTGQTQIVFQTDCLLNNSMFPTPCLFIQFDHVSSSHSHKIHIVILQLIFLYFLQWILFFFFLFPFFCMMGWEFLPKNEALTYSTNFYVWHILWKIDLAVIFSSRWGRFKLSLFSYFISGTYFSMEILPDLAIETVPLALLWHFRM